MKRIQLAAVSLLFVVTLAPAATAPKPSTSITVIGTLTKGVECQALREDKTKKIFTFTTKPKGFKNGDHVKVTGKVVEISFCQQGTTISVTKIVKV